MSWAWASGGSSVEAVEDPLWLVWIPDPITGSQYLGLRHKSEARSKGWKRFDYAQYTGVWK